MSKEKAQSTLQRRLFVLESVQRLSHTGRWVTQQDIVADLNSQGYAVEKHHVLRDLKALQPLFRQLEMNDNERDGAPAKGLAYGYRWHSQGETPETGLTIAEALSLAMVERYLKEALPQSLTQSLDGLFGQAKRTLEFQKQSPEARWAEKICVVQPTQPLIPPHIPEEVSKVVHEALLREEQFQVSYRNAEGNEQELVLHPLGLMQRGPSTYLIATCFDYEDIRLYPLHRMSKPVRLYEPVRKHEGFSIEAYADEHGHFGSGKIVTLKARVSPELATILEETRLEPKQKLSKPDDEGWRVLTARVRDTWQLHWWILSQGERLELLRKD